MQGWPLQTALVVRRPGQGVAGLADVRTLRPVAALAQ